MENYEYQDYKSLLEDITNGKYVINQPLKIDGNEISFSDTTLKDLQQDTYWLTAVVKAYTTSLTDEKLKN